MQLFHTFAKINAKSMHTIVRGSPPKISWETLVASKQGESDVCNEAIINAFNANGLGIIIVDNVPGLKHLRSRVLGISRYVANLAPDARLTYLKEAAIGSDTPSGAKLPASSASMQISWKGDDPFSVRTGNPNDLSLNDAQIPGTTIEGVNTPEELHNDMDTLGKLMVHTCALVASACDRLCGYAAYSEADREDTDYLLEQVLLDAGTAKARLIHYFPENHKYEYHKQSAQPKVRKKKENLHKKKKTEEKQLRRKLKREQEQAAIGSDAESTIQPPNDAQAESLIFGKGHQQSLSISTSNSNMDRQEEMEREVVESLLESKGREVYDNEIAKVSEFDTQVVDEQSNVAARTVGRSTNSSTRTEKELRGHFSNSEPSTPKSPDSKPMGNTTHSESTIPALNWQRWHFDYGLFTALLGPKYTLVSDYFLETGKVGQEIALTEDQTLTGNDRHTPSSVSPAIPQIRQGIDVTRIFPSLFPLAGLIVLQVASPKDSSGSVPTNPNSLSDPDTCTNHQLVVVHIPEDAIAVQIGETAQILSGGALSATPHGVIKPQGCGNPDLHEELEALCRSALSECTDAISTHSKDQTSLLKEALTGVSVDHDLAKYISRDMFVIFCQSDWKTKLQPLRRINSSSLSVIDDIDTTQNVTEAVLQASRDACTLLSDVLPSLESRWQCGMSFSDFSKKTTNAYYGARGIQDQKTAASHR